MEILGLVLMGVGGLIAIVGSIWFLIEAFKSGILWGLGCLFVPFVSLIWLVTHWEDGAKPFGLSLLGTLIMVGGMFLGGNM